MFVEDVIVVLVWFGVLGGTLWAGKVYFLPWAVRRTLAWRRVREARLRKTEAQAHLIATQAEIEAGELELKRDELIDRAFEERLANREKAK